MLVYSVLHLPNPREVSMENILSKFKLQIEVLLERKFFWGGEGEGAGAGGTAGGARESEIQASRRDNPKIGSLLPEVTIFIHV